LAGALALQRLKRGAGGPSGNLQLRLGKQLRQDLLRPLIHREVEVKIDAVLGTVGAAAVEAEPRALRRDSIHLDVGNRDEGGIPGLWP
jgi:hypothetical protein